MLRTSLYENYLVSLRFRFSCVLCLETLPTHLPGHPAQPSLLGCWWGFRTSRISLLFRGWLYWAASNCSALPLPSLPAGSPPVGLCVVCVGVWVERGATKILFCLRWMHAFTSVWNTSVKPRLCAYVYMGSLSSLNIAGQQAKVWHLQISGLYLRQWCEYVPRSLSLPIRLTTWSMSPDTFNVVREKFIAK